MKDLREMQKILAKNKSLLFEKYPIKNLAIFGSFVRNEQKEDSDLDVLVEFNDKIGIEFINLANELEEILEIKVDLVSSKGVKSKYLDSIREDLIYLKTNSPSVIF
ncbi:nucleotidyltransferase family protein [Belliella sp. DSM 107340]|uniref:Nucleotidyltransferase family protein n=1 Tax=Belliella calami TaxID=2923436 RepID=A0ABS9UM41_9BACT|nr:nucleotidyltransferase family protein [Belliella calami]MCH7397434.1 nucleotidyltransferase family protein [Belliella calami]